MKLAVSYTNDGSRLSEEDLVNPDKHHFWQVYMRTRAQRPSAEELPAEFAIHARHAVGHSFSSDGQYAERNYKAVDMKRRDVLECLKAIRVLFRELSTQDISDAVEKLSSDNNSNIKVLRPTLVRREVEKNPFGHHSTYGAYVVGHAAAAAQEERRVIAKGKSLLTPFADYLRAHPQKMKGDQLALRGGEWGDLSHIITFDREYARRLLTNAIEFDDLESAARKPLHGMENFSWWHRRPKSGSSGTLYFGGLCRYDLTKEMLGGLEVGFETLEGHHYTTLRPIYSWQKAWDIEEPNGHEHYVTLYGPSGEQIDRYIR